MMPEAKPGPLTLQTPIPVTRYRGESEAYNARLDEIDWFLDPPLLHDALRQVGPQTTDSEQDRVQKRLIAGATPIVVEAPVFYVLPRAESNLWNHELLVSDLCDSVKSYGEDEKEAGAADLKNVLFQFSPLEQVFWGRAGEQTKLTLMRGLWMVRLGENLLTAQVAQEFPGTALQVGPTQAITFDKEKRRVVCRRASELQAPMVELTTIPGLAKAVFSALHLLRSLTPQWKAEARPFQYVCPEPQDGTFENSYWIGEVSDAARLRRVKGADGGPDWFVMRKKEQMAAPFTTGGKVSRFVEIKSNLPFIDMVIKVHARTGPAGS